MTPANSEPFVIERIFAAPRETVWKAWTDREALNQWFGPKDSKGEIIEYDLRPGGFWRGWMEMPDGSRMYSVFRFREIVAPERLVWEHSFGDAEGNIVRAPFPGQWPLVMLTDVRFADHDGGTKITLSFAPLDASAEEIETFDQAKPGMTEGWGGSFDALDNFLSDR